MAYGKVFGGCFGVRIVHSGSNMVLNNMLI